MIVRLTQIDGKLPNLALMKLGRWHRDRGDDVRLSRSVYRDMLEPAYDRVYGSAIFSFSAQRLGRFRAEWPGAIVGGTGTGDNRTVEELIGDRPDSYDYDLYPDFTGSIGFAARGCRLKCGFCVVPRKEGKPRAVNRISDIWRGEPWPRHVHLLDNDFFGSPEWRERIAEIRDGGFKVCFNQGINVRLIDDEVAAALASLKVERVTKVGRKVETLLYRDDQFKEPRLYTAWDNIGDERVFFAGVDRLERAGIPPCHLMTYMLVGYDRRETWERVFHRFDRMVARGIEPFPMVYGDRDRRLPTADAVRYPATRRLRDFARWAITGLYRSCAWPEYVPNARRVEERPPELALPTPTLRAERRDG